jgi:integrase
VEGKKYMGKLPKLKDERLYWRGTKIWCRVPDRHGKFTRKSTNCRDEKAAIAKADEFERESADPRIAAGKETRWEDAVRGLLAELRRRGRAKDTVEKNEWKLAHYPRIWADEGAEPWTAMPIGEIDAEKVNKYIDQRIEERASRLTIRDELTALRQLLKLYRRLKKYPHDPKEVLPERWETGHKPRENWYTQENAWRIVYDVAYKRAPKGVTNRFERSSRVAWHFATGGRLAEGERAERSDVRWNESLVRVRGTKTEEADKDVPITRLTKAFLEFALKHAPGETVLFKEWGKIDRDIKAACRRLKLPPCSTNDFRRSFAKWHRNAGVEPSLLGPMLRHTTPTLAQTTYGKVEGAEVRDLVHARLDRETPGSKKGKRGTSKADARVTIVAFVRRRGEEALATGLAEKGMALLDAAELIELGRDLEA